MAASVHLELQIVGAAHGLPAENEIRDWLQAAVRAASPEDARRFEVVVRIVDEAESRELNHRYRRMDKATNVLAFPAAGPGDFLRDCPGVTGPGPVALGDLVLCGPVIGREAGEQDKHAAAHWGHMLVHGTLHLLGYDHVTDEEAARMERLETRILAARGIRDPYAPR